MAHRAPVLPLLPLALLAAHCGGGAYGYAREYEPLSAEDDLLETADTPTYEDVRRDPASRRSSLVTWFGVVEDMMPVGEGRYRLTLSHRTLQPRNYCADETSGSCRVTVSERDGGRFIAVLRLAAEDEAPGAVRVAPGSLLRVFGHPQAELMKLDFSDPEGFGFPALTVTWYRHWPRAEYATTGASSIMRR